ncbi:MAG: decaprenyl-phosphate phosphoribosyltransferase [Candidatus Coatesbacteria bacterium]|nr:MAG: decaprenyl-phosphate phosphoribosyltransferase [Candidatus Coatesbacteria bacterium]
MIAAVLKLMRPRQWTKNLILFVAVVFAGRALVLTDALNSVLGFVLFCFLSSSVYVLNDVVDAPYDRRHPVKKDRPIASGRISRGAGAVLFAVFAAGSLGLSFWMLGWKFGACAVTYFVLNLGYSFGLKRVVIVDVVVIAMGFVARAVAGIYAIVAEPGQISEWLLICTFFLALFLGFSKRRGEITDLSENAVAHRPILASYSPKLIDEMVGITTASSVMSYSLYTIWPGTVARLGTKNMIYTIPFVVYGIFRYLYLIHKKGKGASPSAILIEDRPLQGNILLYVAAVFLILYVFK